MFFFTSFFAFTSVQVYSMELTEKELSIHQLTRVQLDSLNEKIENNKKNNINKTFNSHEVIINVLSPDHDLSRIIQNSSGEIETRCIVPEGFTYTFKQDDRGFYPYISSTRRPKRLDGKYAKQNSDGSINLGRLYYKDMQSEPGSSYITCPIAPLSQEVKTDLYEAQKQRRPEGLRDKSFTPRTKIENKPTPEDLAKIEQSKREKRSAQLDKFEEQFKKMSPQLQMGKEVDEIVKHIELGLNLLSKNIENEKAFDLFSSNVQDKLSKLNAEIHKERLKIYAKQPLFDVFPVSSFGEEKSIQKEVKEGAKLQIAIQEKKEEMRENRPNANPIIIINDEKENIEEKKKNTVAYVFSTCTKHAIIDDLKGTSSENSSYVQVKISRERLRNFVEFLKNEEKKYRKNAKEEFQDSDDLGYFYDTNQGKGSHIKVSFGRGIKPIILSQQGGSFLTVEQLRDIKNALIEKGLINRENNNSHGEEI